LATVIGLFSRQVVGFAIGERTGAQLVVDALRMAWFRPKPELAPEKCLRGRSVYAASASRRGIHFLIAQGEGLTLLCRRSGGHGHFDGVHGSDASSAAGFDDRSDIAVLKGDPLRSKAVGDFSIGRAGARGALGTVVRRRDFPVGQKTKRWRRNVTPAGWGTPHRLSSGFLTRDRGVEGGAGSKHRAGDG
jgi:hypothetical protein